MRGKFYITTAIDYVNSLPHLGTAYEKIAADAIARFKRMEGYDVHFQMGNDEHSANVKKEADKRGIDAKKYCDEMRVKFEAIWKSLEISYDDFIQTSEPRHHRGVTAFIELVRKNSPNDLFEKEYEGWYCESCEAFQTEKDLVDGKCPNHKTTPKWLKERNYFFRLSAYREKLLKHYKDHPEFILPEIRRNEVVRFVETELQDISVSRASFPWGIPFPNDPTHVVYVWFDALVNYLSAIGFGDPKKGDSRRLWPADLHVVGKDITRFHCVIWPAMLMSAGLPIPKTVFGHGFVFLKGEKMSKSLGNVLTPLDIVPRFGADALRYYLLRESSFGSDGDFTWDNFIKRYNSDLANDVGNLLNRTLGMANRYLSGVIRRPTVPEQEEEKPLREVVAGVLSKVRTEMDYAAQGDVDFHTALASVWEVIAAADKYIDTSAPWKLAKDGKTAEIGRVLYNVADTLRNVALLISPFIPAAARKIWEQLGLTRTLDFEKQTFENVAWGKTPDTNVTEGTPIFPRIEPPETKTGDKKMATTAAPADGLLDIADFAKVDLRVAEVKQAEKVEGADKLLKLQVEIGGVPRQIVAGIAQHYTPEEIVGKKVVVVANLKPAKIRGVESNGMLLAASDENGLSVVTLDRLGLASGAKVK
ncbi:MAG TPA: methionine--tRNA ligase [bacterium]|nr:methionine--tRNA ligase [bacterium]